MKNIFSVVIFLLIGHSLSAQEVKDYILFKNYPYYVSMMPNGKILEFISEAPDAMKLVNFRNQTPPIPLGIYVVTPQKALEVYNSPLNSTEIGEANPAIIAEVKAPKDIKIDQQKDNVVFETTMEKQLDAKSDIKTNTVDISNKTLKDFEYNLKFQGFNARLTPDLTLQINDISKEYARHKEKSITIRSFVTSGDQSNMTLANNRMDACRDLLQTYGVPADKIVTKVEPYKTTNDGQVNIIME